MAQPICCRTLAKACHGDQVPQFGNQSGCTGGQCSHILGSALHHEATPSAVDSGSLVTCSLSSTPQAFKPVTHSMNVDMFSSTSHTEIAVIHTLLLSMSTKADIQTMKAEFTEILQSEVARISTRVSTSEAKITQLEEASRLPPT